MNKAFSKHRQNSRWRHWDHHSCLFLPKNVTQGKSSDSSFNSFWQNFVPNKIVFQELLIICPTLSVSAIFRIFALNLGYQVYRSTLYGILSTEYQTYCKCMNILLDDGMGNVVKPVKTQDWNTYKVKKKNNKYLFNLNFLLDSRMGNIFQPGQNS